ncbi:tripartite tricarboxylate transporter substrate binding protein [Roseomonas terrae]|jgi:tripartite-type tricarboxylate transporter receptor subunit TctC|uniref:Tripartite tricarboxylate transporter substrate binding protein n=1 Tax=Neoroseomonas terrae TaxID=424799 RepID=A0ABS5EMG5_9PROT|nr:tripartite tricarboxylate transporter substrate binding protein [Neoroseomonas terrae]MBR0652229.1 tripartite tricarboxylate transporter substrate binding protein [Neoroseomonas terrae]
MIGFAGRRSMLAISSAALLARPALAQARYPDRPIRMLVPWTPGGATDIQMRSVSEQASRRLGQPVVVENKPGASGTLGAQLMAREARPDGYTLGQMPNGVFRMPAMMERPLWDPMRDFSWIIRLVGYMGGVVVRPDSPWRNMQDVVDFARANPGVISYGTPGANTTEVQMTRFARLAGVEWVAVPFRGAAPNLQALLSGDIHFSAETSAWADMALEGRVRVLGVWMTERAPRFPDVPTFREQGFDVLGESTYGIAGPRGMEPEVVRILHDAFKEALYDPAHLATIARFDMPVRYLGTEDYATAAMMQNEEEKRTVQELGLRAS